MNSATAIQGKGTGPFMTLQPAVPRIEYWPLDRLIFYARNPRKNDPVVDRMVASIREYGFKQVAASSSTTSMPK